MAETKNIFLKLIRPIALSVLLSACSTPSHARPLAEVEIMAHRGLYQTYPRENVKPDTCTAEIIYPPTHTYLENTIPSMAKGFELNADSIELDIHSTSDGKIVVFHDWTVECRTEGKGVTQELPFDYLRSLDIGYGYTADNHKTHPFRCEPQLSDYADCRKRNQMPTLREVLQAFPINKFVVNMKSRSQFTLDTLVADLKSIATDLKYNLNNLSFYCNDPAINAEFKKRLPQVEVPKLSMAEIKVCIDSYFKTGLFPSSCSEAHLALPIEDFKKLGQSKGQKLIDDVHKINGKFAIIRVDTASDAKYVEQFDVDVIWTDRIDLVGPLVDFSKVKADLSTYDDKVKSLKEAFANIPVDPHNKDWVKKKLSHMVEVDQYMRTYLSVVYDHHYTKKEERYFWQEFGARWKDIDAGNTVDLKKLLEIYDWFKVSEFDKQADQNAWLLVQHADHDPAFQKEVLGKLEKLYRIGEASPQNYAYLFDRVAASHNDLSKRKPQRYGTQGMCVGPGKWEPIPIENPADVDRRRAEVGLGPLQEYIDGFKTICR